MSTLRKRLIRLAYRNPEMRRELLPVLRKQGATAFSPSIKLGEAFYASSMAIAKEIVKNLRGEADFSKVSIDPPATPARFFATSRVDFEVEYTDGRPNAKGYITVWHGYYPTDKTLSLEARFTFVGKGAPKTGTILEVSTDWDASPEYLAKKYGQSIADRFFSMLM